MAKKTKIHESILKVLDPETNEMVMTTSRKTFTYNVRTEHFFSIYVSYIAVLADIKSLSDVRVLTVMCEMAEYDTGAVHINQFRREELCEKSGVDKSNISRSIKRLTDLDLITVDKGTYYISPKYFWKGKQETRNKIMEDKGAEILIRLKTPENEK